MLQIFDTFEQILQSLLRLEQTVAGLVLITSIILLCNIATARNTQALSKSHTQPHQKQVPSLYARVRQRLRPSRQLPEGDKKELVEK